LLLQPLDDLAPERRAGTLGHVVGLALHDVAVPVARDGDPIGLVEEEGRRQDDAADGGVGPGRVALTAVPEDLRPEGGTVGSPFFWPNVSQATRSGQNSCLTKAPPPTMKS
jgi:hypothetical protein